MKKNKPQQIIIYQTDNGKTKVEVRFEHENVWLSQKLMAELFDTTKQNISLHLLNIFKENELDQNSVVKDFLTTVEDFSVVQHVRIPYMFKYKWGYD